MRGTAILPEVTGVSFDDDAMWVALTDGRTVGVPLAWYPRLLAGSSEARADCFISPSGIHWDTLDEDISIASILVGLHDAAEAA